MDLKPPIVLLLSILCAASCADTGGNTGSVSSDLRDTQQKLATTLTQVSDLSGQVTVLSTQVKSLEAQLYALTRRTLSLELDRDSYKTAIFDPAVTKGFQRLDSNGATFLVSLENVTPYLTGFKANFDIGNPSSATYSGFTLTAKWGPPYDVEAAVKDDSYLSKWQAAQHEKATPFTEDLRPGSWNRAQMTLAPARTEEIASLQISIETNQVRLRATTSREH